MIETEIERLLNATYTDARNRGLSPDDAWNEREELAKLFSTGADVFSGREKEDGAKACAFASRPDVEISPDNDATVIDSEFLPLRVLDPRSLFCRGDN